MVKEYSRAQVTLGRLAFWLLVGFTAAGLVFYGFPSFGSLERVWQSLWERREEAFSFRFTLQPVVGAVVAMLDGYSDAKSGEPPYIQKLLTSPGERTEILREALYATSRIILLGLLIDTIFQITVFKSFFPFQAAAIAILLGLVPYMLLRGPFRRVAGLWLNRAR